MQTSAHDPSTYFIYINILRANAPQYRSTMARRRREKRQVGRPFRPRAGQHEPRRREPAGSSLEDNRSPTALRADILRRLDAGTLILKSKPVSDQPGSSHDYDQRQSIFNEDATAAQLSSSLRPDMSFDLRPGSLIPKACGLDGHDGRSQEEYRFWRSEFCGVFARVKLSVLRGSKY